MKNTQLDQKRRAVSDSSEKKQRPDQDQPHFRERSFTDVFSFLSKMLKVTKKDPSTDTTQSAEIYPQPTVPPALPPKLNNYYLNEALNKVEVISEDVYSEVSFERRMNVESDLWISKPGDELPNLEATREENNNEDDDDTDEDSEEDEAVDGPPKTTETHKRNISGWSFGSFHIGAPFELMNEVLTGEEWAQFLENNLISQYSDEPNENLCEFETRQEMPKDAAEGGESTEEGSKSMDPNIDDIIKSVKIVEEKVETPEELEEEPEPPHRLPPVLTLTSTAGIDKCFRSSVFYKYKLPPAGQEPRLETPKTGYLALRKKKAKLRKSSA